MTIHPFEQLKQQILTRRSIFPVSYENREITRDIIEQLLACADAAPTHKLTQPWRFTVFRGTGLTRLAEQLVILQQNNTPEELLSQKKLDTTREKILRSGAVISISVAYSGQIPEWEELAATACAVQNMWLAASVAGIGSYWSSPGFINQLGDFLGSDEHLHCIGLFYMGYHNELEREANRKPLTDKVRWEE